MKNINSFVYNLFTKQIAYIFPHFISIVSIESKKCHFAALNISEKQFHFSIVLFMLFRDPVETSNSAV